MDIYTYIYGHVYLSIHLTFLLLSLSMWQMLCSSLYKHFFSFHFKACCRWQNRYSENSVTSLKSHISGTSKLKIQAWFACAQKTPSGRKARQQRKIRGWSWSTGTVLRALESGRYFERKTVSRRWKAIFTQAGKFCSKGSRCLDEFLENCTYIRYLKEIHLGLDTHIQEKQVWNSSITLHMEVKRQGGAFKQKYFMATLASPGTRSFEIWWFHVPPKTSWSRILVS